MDNPDQLKSYTSGEITVHWQPDKCIHSTLCWKRATGLPEVFNPAKRPWIKPEAASKQDIIQVVDRCPSGALSYTLNNVQASPQDAPPGCVVESLPNGPLLIHGDVQVKDANGIITQKSKVTAFCRCGASANKPYCDGSHVAIQFNG
jgi:uncharacterized Fe-S cluster protein YjdI